LIGNIKRVGAYGHSEVKGSIPIALIKKYNEEGKTHKTKN